MELPQEIAPGDPNELHIILSYTGKFRSDLTGLYQASYETDDGVKHRIAATAMEPTYAREVRVSRPLMHSFGTIADSWLTYRRSSLVSMNLA